MTSSAARTLRYAATLAASALPAFSQAVLSQTAQQAATEYRFSFPEAVHHVMQVDVTFHAIPAGPLRVQMSRSSPGRYAAFEFASNVYEERFTDEAGHPLPVTRPDPRSWTVTGHHGTVHLTYKLFGDKVDGTFFAVDTTHAHINFPAVAAWAQGFDDRPDRVTFTLPAGSDWKIATQLYPTGDAQTFTAPNLQYLMDSPAELSNFTLRTFDVPALTPGGKTETIRVVAHSQATPAEFDTYVTGVEKLVREEQAVFGELPHYEPGSYTFLADAFPWDGRDGMEHRNSTVMTGGKLNLGTVAHEYFHNWNVERIRPEGLEPFNFRDINMSGLMFIAEGFTQYYGNLSMLRTGLTPANHLNSFAGDISYLLLTPGSQYRSAMDMSRLAPFVDGVRGGDDFPTDFNNTFISYYSFGDDIALGLDLTLRSRTHSRVTLDDFMRSMWLSYGKPGGSAPGLVGHPYTIADVQTTLAKVSGDPAFAADFVHSYMQGTEKLDYAALLLQAGFILRPQSGAPTLGILNLKPVDGKLHVASSTYTGSPAYLAGLDRGDDLISVGSTPLTTEGDLTKALGTHKPGDTVDLVFLRRGVQTHGTATLIAPQELEIVPIETTGSTLTPEQQTFRAAWLNSNAKP